MAIGKGTIVSGLQQQVQEAADELVESGAERGTKTGYHAYTFGYIVGEVVRRATGKPISQVLREEVAGPLGIADELFFGMPESELGRLARLEDVEGSGVPHRQVARLQRRRPRPERAGHADQVRLCRRRRQQRLRRHRQRGRVRLRQEPPRRRLQRRRAPRRRRHEGRCGGLSQMRQRPPGRPEGRFVVAAGALVSGCRPGGRGPSAGPRRRPRSGRARRSAWAACSTR
jgi:CubicO group peptidase (beta-lactamase class C family)